MKILVTGGTGTLGRHVVPRLREAGAEVTTLSRNGDIACDLLAGNVPAIDADVVVHLAGGQPVRKRLPRRTSRSRSCAPPSSTT